MASGATADQNMNLANSASPAPLGAADIGGTNATAKALRIAPATIDLDKVSKKSTLSVMADRLE